MNLPLIPLLSAPRFWLDTPLEELRAWLGERGQPPMRLRQIRQWLFARQATDFSQMTDLPRSLREELSANYTCFSTTIARRLTASDGTEKLLLRLSDGKLVECVLLKEADRRTVCISTQVGCAMGCVFCASGLEGVERNLTVAELLEQLLHARNLLPPTERLTHVVVMGMGEPLANLDTLLSALSDVTAKDGLGMSARHIHISTVGLPAKIRRLAEMQLSYHLAVSLHAPNDELRTRIVPTNANVGLDAILEAADYFQATTGRQVTYEYVLLRELNDRPEHARELAGRLSGRQAHVNLIPFNNVSGLGYRRPAQEALSEFVETLKRGRISVKVRKRKGADIDAACGQLRREVLQNFPGSKPEPAPVPGVQ